ncbi:MAG: BREX-2 system adenine-specific DNA-methyltransferase PglX, partial [bacterium]
MIDAPRLLKDLQRLVKELEEDLRERASAQPELDARLREQYREARDAGRTGHAFEVWRDELLTQVSVAWVLGCVFVRFMEDNDLVETPRLSGPGERRQRALDQHELYFRDPDRRTHSDREYLEHVFAEMQKLPAARELFDAAHNPLWLVGISGDAATRLLEFWQRVSPETGALDHDFRDPDWNTRFLGDLYQDLSESARKRYALLQTPEFVEEFILDRSLTPAIETFGFQEIRLIDPTCGSGHFLLGAFERLFDLHAKHEPAANPRELVQRALDQVHGVDLNPFAVSIAKFRLLIAGLRSCGVKRLVDAPGFHLNLAVGDSLLHGKRFVAFSDLAMAQQSSLDPAEDRLRHVYETEDAELLSKILGQQYHVVVANPPYITVKDKALNQAYRDAYSSCHGKYSLGVPFTQRCFELAQSSSDTLDAGFVGMITTNSFMKRESGKKLIPETLPRLDLTHVIDTSGAYIPGHGTPTVILFGRNRAPVANEIRTATGIRGEPETPEDPQQGHVWRSIVDQLDSPGAENEFVSIADYPRERFRTHPWSLGGGGAAELKELVEAGAEVQLGNIVDSIGITCFTLEDDLYLLPVTAAKRHGLNEEGLRPMVVGEAIRDWG